MVKALSLNRKNVLTIAIGASILAFGTYNLNFQNNITEGGILGLLLLFKNLFNISPAITCLVLDISLFILGVKFFGKKFLAYSLTSTLSFSVSYNIFESLGFFIPNLSNNMLFASILAGLFVGIGIGLIVKSGGAAGGDDVIALIVSKLSFLKVNHVYLITDLIVLLLSLSYLEFNEIFWSLIAVTVSGKTISIIYHSSEKNLIVDELSVDEENLKS